MSFFLFSLMTAAIQLLVIYLVVLILKKALVDVIKQAGQESGKSIMQVRSLIQDVAYYLNQFKKMKGARHESKENV